MLLFHFRLDFFIFLKQQMKNKKSRYYKIISAQEWAIILYKDLCEKNYNYGEQRSSLNVVFTCESYHASMMSSEY
ncbi:unnamed protein product [Photorhabdus laumondii subsp. laumondii TTO1]|uniref:Photorhabdus luminescens subsp. laumondii TTO1 complete genome segment 9/17 n=1 Tax=Photorhabdus laumondii subsp. laumondii (strain DSM 15139 / CIP 105565 / TT01) TaxID=243265 RepID=Q7N3Y6_PHOLL|nr:unnamed protein product [Photorhabdus laumondii subsp. laumondii TTO1]